MTTGNNFRVTDGTAGPSLKVVAPHNPKRRYLAIFNKTPGGDTLGIGIVNPTTGSVGGLLTIDGGFMWSPSVCPTNEIVVASESAVTYAVHEG